MINLIALQAFKKARRKNRRMVEYSILQGHLKICRARLNFLKERRSQIASELETFDKGRNSSVPVQNFYQGSGSEYNQPLPNIGKCQDTKGQSFERRRELENYESHNSLQEMSHKEDRAKAEARLERGKSKLYPTPEKGHCKMAPRTYSR